MEGSIEQLYPRSKADYERYIDKIFSLMNKHTFEKDKKEGGAQCVSVMQCLLEKCLGEATPEEIKELSKIVDDIINKKIEQQNKEQGKVKSKLKGNKLYEDGGGDFSHLLEEKEEDKVDEAEKQRLAKEQVEREKKDELAQAEMKRKEAEREELQKALKKEERKVDTSQFAGLQMVSKKDGDDFMGFGGKKKGKKK